MYKQHTYYTTDKLIVNVFNKKSLVFGNISNKKYLDKF